MKEKWGMGDEGEAKTMRIRKLRIEF